MYNRLEHAHVCERVLERIRRRVTAEQRALLAREPKGEVTVAVTVTDEAGIEPIQCEFVWAWVPKEKPQA